jgi:hypothetical protein
MVPKGRFELPRPYGHYALNVARLPVPPLRLVALASAGKYSTVSMASSNGFIVRGLQRLDGIRGRFPALRRPSRVRATLYSKEGCTLCHEAESVVLNVFGRDAVDVVDIIGDRELEDAYIFRIPVLVVDGKIVAEGQITMADARSARAAARAATKPGERR